MRNLAPHIKRQRLVFEGKRNASIGSEQIVDYFLRLSDLLKMHTIGEVVTSCCRAGSAISASFGCPNGALSADRATARQRRAPLSGSGAHVRSTWAPARVHKDLEAGTNGL